jgi:hypothetical protein
MFFPQSTTLEGAGGIVSGQGTSMRYTRMVVVVLLMGLAGPASAEEAGLLARIEFHGFVSQGFLVSTENNYLADSEGGSFQFSEVGLNATVELSDELRAGLQLFTRDLGPLGDYRAVFDWFYLDYRARDWLGLRAGRVKLPFGLYNESSDIDAARTAILLPGSVYPAQNRDYLLAYTGIEAYGFLSLGAAGALEYRAGIGTIFLDQEVEAPEGSPFQILDVTIPYVVGGRLLWEPPVEGLRLGGSLHAVRLDTQVRVTGVPELVDYRLPVFLWVASAEYAKGDLLLATEYSRWHGKSESSRPDLVPEESVITERAYVMATYRVKPWLVPGAYFSLFFPDTEARSGTAQQQHDLAVTVRFDVNPYWLIKLEAHYIHGTAALSSALNDNLPLDQLAPDWGLFLAKTTAYF